MNGHGLYAVVLVFMTTFVHAGCTAAVLAWLRRFERAESRRPNVLGSSMVLAALVLVMGVAAFAESALWAGLYVWVGALADFSEALYFSLVTYTTLGYGDVTLGPDWRLMGAFQAANGIIMFGWTTALIVAVVQRLLLEQAQDEHG